MKNAIIVLSFLLACLLAVALYLHISDVRDRKNAPTAATPTSTAEPATQAKTTLPPETEPVETATEPSTEPQKPETTQKPTETTQEPSTEELSTEEPSTEPPSTEPPSTEPPVQTEHSGSFYSNTGTGVNLQVDWKTYRASDGRDMVRFTVSLNTYSLYVGERKNGLTIRMGDEKITLDTASISLPGGTKTTVTLGQCEMELKDESVNVEVSWAFRGSYSNVHMERITAAGFVSKS